MNVFRNKQLEKFRKQNQRQEPNQQNAASNERPVRSSNMPQNVQPIEIINQNQPTEKRKKLETSKSFSTFNNTLFIAPPKQLNLELSNSISIVCYFDYSQPSKFSRIYLVNDQPKHFRKKKKQNNNHTIKTDIKTEEDNNKTEIKEDSSFGVDLSKHSPIPHFSKEQLYSFDDDEEEEEYIYKNNAYPNDVMKKYWPKKRESKIFFETEFVDMNRSTRVKSIRNLDIIPNGSPLKEKIPLVPEQVVQMQEKYEKIPKPPHSPFHGDNPRQKMHFQRNKELLDYYSESPSVSDEKNDEYSNSVDFEEESEEEYNSKSKSKDEIKSEAENKDEKEYLFSKTNENIKKEIDSYEELIKEMSEKDIFQMIFSIENELKVFNNMTGIKGPLYEDEMTVIRPENANCEIIDTIRPKAFEEFRFGNCVYYSDDISPDELHINAWHNLGIDPDHMTVCLDKFIQQNINGKNDISNIYGVLRYIFKWVHLYPDDFVSSECAIHVGKVLNRIIEKRDDISSRPALLKALINAISQRNISFAAVQYPLPEYKKLKSTKRYKTGIYDKIFKYKDDIDKLVQHLTYIDISMLRKVLRSEIIQLNFLKEDKSLSPNVQKIAARFNILARFVSYSILSVVRNNSKKLVKKCKSRIEFWISVMKKARENKNFNLLYEIDAGLKHPSVDKLSVVWDNISKSQRDEFNKLHKITTPDGCNIKKYFELVLKEPKKTVPFLATFLNQIAVTYEYYKSYSKNKLVCGSKDGNESAKDSGYNMVYQYDLYKKSSLIFLDWGADYEFQLNDHFLHVCEDISMICDEERLREFSNQIQPRNTS